MANNDFSQQALSNDPTFRQRLKAAFARVAFAVLAEPPATPNHGLRKTYALQVIQNPDSIVGNLIGTIVFQNAIFSLDTVVVFDGRGGTVVQSPVTNIALDTLLTNAWDLLSGV